MDEKKKFDELSRKIEAFRDGLKKMEKELDELTQRVEERREAAEWPRDGEEYWHLNEFGGSHASIYRNESVEDVCRWRIGNVFRTEEDADEAVRLLTWLADDPVRWRHIKVWKRMMDMADGGPYSIFAGLKPPSEKICSPTIGIVPPEHSCSSTVPTFSTLKKADECIQAIGNTPIMSDYFGLTKWN